jgi:hypothetical protein
MFVIPGAMSMRRSGEWQRRAQLLIGGYVRGKNSAGIKPAPPHTKVLTGWGGLYARQFLAECITANRQLHSAGRSPSSPAYFSRTGTCTS